jgi:ribonucleotide monophosphatase NagD (HAD superfamily)
MVGDDLRCDMEPAAALGMRRFHVQPGVPGRGVLDAVTIILGTGSLTA